MMILSKALPPQRYQSELKSEKKPKELKQSNTKVNLNVKKGEITVNPKRTLSPVTASYSRNASVAASYKQIEDFLVVNSIGTNTKKVSKEAMNESVSASKSYTDPSCSYD